MSFAMLDHCALEILEAAAAEDDPLRSQVRELLAGLYPPGAFERRHQQRYPFPRLISLQPVAADGASPIGPVCVVSGKHLSESGLSFFHPEPLPYRLVVASLERPDRRCNDFLLDVDWCRFTQLGWYESGGKFLRALGEHRDAPSAS